MVGLFTDNDVTAYSEEVRDLAVCQDSNLSLNDNKMKVLIVDYRRIQRPSTPPFSSTGL